MLQFVILPSKVCLPVIIFVFSFIVLDMALLLIWFQLSGQ